MTEFVSEGGGVLIQKVCQRFIVLQTPGLLPYPCTPPLSACASNVFSHRLGGDCCTFPVATGPKHETRKGGSRGLRSSLLGALRSERLPKPTFQGCFVQRNTARSDS